MNFDLSLNDQFLLENLRIERFRSFFATSLSNCPLFLAGGCELLIVCEEARQVDDLLEDPDTLLYFARIVLGVEVVALYFAEEEVWRGYVQAGQGVLSLKSANKETLMTTATLEPSVTTAKVSEPRHAQPLKTLDEMIGHLAQITGRSHSDLEAEIGYLDFPVFEFEGRRLISPDMGDRLIDEWAEQIKLRMRQPMPVPTNAKNGAASPSRSAKKPAAKRTTKSTAKKPAAKQSTKNSAAKTPANPA